MWLNSRELSGDDDGVVTRGGVWSFASSSASAAASASTSPPVSASRALWNRMETAEEEREEEALPSYLSYLQPAFRPAPTTATTLASTHSSTASSDHLSQARAPASTLYGAKRGAPGLAPPPAPPLAPLGHAAMAPMASDGGVAQVALKSSELAQALEQLVLGSLQQHAGSSSSAAASGGKAAGCACSCEALRLRVAEVSLQVQALQTQVLELSQSNPPATASAAAKGSASNANNGSWRASAPVFVPQQHPKQPPLPPSPPPDAPAPASPASELGSTVEPSMATVLSDRISTLEGRQSAFQSQLAQVTKVLGLPSGKPGKHSPVKHLVQTLRDEVDAKVQQATSEAREQLTAELDAALAQLRASSAGVGSTDASASDSKDGEPLTTDAVLAALAGEHEASLVRLSDSFEELLAQEARQRAALDARVAAQMAQQEEWLQQLEGAFSSRHDHEDQDGVGVKTRSVAVLDARLEALERACAESREQWQERSRVVPTPAPDGARTRADEKLQEEEEDEEGMSWPGHMGASG